MRHPTWNWVNSYMALFQIFICMFYVGLPVFISKPHCLDCDPEYFKNISGYHPDREKHDAFSYIEPVSSFEIAVVTV